MRVLTKSKLARMTRLAFLALLRRAANELVATPEHSPERENALVNVRRINRVLAQRQPEPS